MTTLGATSISIHEHITFAVTKN